MRISLQGYRRTSSCPLLSSPKDLEPPWPALRGSGTECPQRTSHDRGCLVDAQVLTGNDRAEERRSDDKVGEQLWVRRRRQFGTDDCAIDDRREIPDVGLPE